MKTYYWGCWKQPGHYLFNPGGHSIRRDEEVQLPTPYQLDGGILFLPHPEKVGVGVLTYLPAPDLTILAWWGSPWDARGAVNSAIIVEGRVTADEIWDEFQRYFPEISPEIVKPTLV